MVLVQTDDGLVAVPLVVTGSGANRKVVYTPPGGDRGRRARSERVGRRRHARIVDQQRPAARGRGQPRGRQHVPLRHRRRGDSARRRRARRSPRTSSRTPTWSPPAARRPGAGNALTVAPASPWSATRPSSATRRRVRRSTSTSSTAAAGSRSRSRRRRATRSTSRRSPTSRPSSSSRGAGLGSHPARRHPGADPDRRRRPALSTRRSHSCFWLTGEFADTGTVTRDVHRPELVARRQLRQRRPRRRHPHRPRRGRVAARHDHRDVPERGRERRARRLRARPRLGHRRRRRVHRRQHRRRRHPARRRERVAHHARRDAPDHADRQRRNQFLIPVIIEVIGAADLDVTVEPRRPARRAGPHPPAADGQTRHPAAGDHPRLRPDVHRRDLRARRRHDRSDDDFLNTIADVVFSIGGFGGSGVQLRGTARRRSTSAGRPTATCSTARSSPASSRSRIHDRPARRQPEPRPTGPASASRQSFLVTGSTGDVVTTMPARRRHARDRRAARRRRHRPRPRSTAGPTSRSASARRPASSSTTPRSTATRSSSATRPATSSRSRRRSGSASPTPTATASPATSRSAPTRSRSSPARSPTPAAS